eukprot:355219-Chlamydomonas_euryale.AAC.2
MPCTGSPAHWCNPTSSAEQPEKMPSGRSEMSLWAAYSWRSTCVEDSSWGRPVCKGVGAGVGAH